MNLIEATSKAMRSGALPLPGPGELFVIRDLERSDRAGTPVRYGRTGNLAETGPLDAGYIWYREVDETGAPKGTGLYGLSVDGYLRDKEALLDD